MAEDKDPPEDNETDPPTGDEDEYEAPDRATWDRTTSALEKANAEAKKWRLRATGKDEKWTPRPPAKSSKDDDDEDDEGAKGKSAKVNAAAIRAEADTEAAGKYKPAIVRTAGRTAFQEAGLILPAGKAARDQAFARALRLIDLDDVEVDEDGEVSGLDDQVKAVKRDYPELFAKKGSGSVNAGAGSGGNGAPAGGKAAGASASKLAALITGG